MQLHLSTALFLTFTLGCCDKIGREPLTYAPVPDGIYVPPKNSTVVTLLDFVKAHSELTTLAEVLGECGGSSKFCKETQH